MDMKKAPDTPKKKIAGGELKVLIKYLLITGVSTFSALLLRYILLRFFPGTHTLELPFGSVDISINEHSAYAVYYISSVIIMYLLRWFTAKEVKAGSFLPRFVGFCLLNLVTMLAGEALLTLFLGWGINGELAFWLTCPFTFLINYLGCRLVVFVDSDSREVQQSSSKNDQPKEGARTDGGKED